MTVTVWKQAPNIAELRDLADALTRCLLPDYPKDGGLSEASRQRAMELARKIVLELS
jgi:hypothetical protein